MWLCLKCSQECKSNERAQACPHCGDTRGIPADLATLRSFEITPHELRVLVIWAERWAAIERSNPSARAEMQRVVYGIADRLSLQHPDVGPLTFAGELTQLRDHYGEVDVKGFNELPMEET